MLARARRLPDLVFVALTVLVVATVWVAHHFPSQDGPGHVENIVMWQRLGHTAAVDKYFDFNFQLAPYWTTQLILRALVAVLSPVIAEKVLVTLVVVAMALALRYVLVAIDPERGAVLAVLALPFATSWFLHMGFYGFVAGTAAALWATGYWIKHGASPTSRDLAVVGALFLLCYATHLMAAVLAIGLVGAITLARRSRRLGGSSAGAPSIVAPAVAALPVFALAVGHLLTSDSGSAPRFEGVRYLVHTIAFDPLLASYRSAERLVSAALAMTVWGAVAWVLWHRRRTRGHDARWTDVLLLLVPLSILVGLFSPQRAAGGYIIPERIAWVPALLLLMWLAAQGTLDRWLRPLLAVGVVLTIALAAMRVPSYREWSDNVDELDTVAAQIPPGATVLPVTVLPYQEAPNFYRTEPMLYASSWIAIDHGAIDLSNLEAHEISPVHYRDGLDPYAVVDRAFSSHEGPPVQVNLDGLAPAGGSIDFIVLIGADRDPPHDPATDAFMRELEQRYELVMTTQPGKWVRLYRLRH